MPNRTDRLIGQFKQGIVIQTVDNDFGHVIGFGRDKENNITIRVSMSSGSVDELYPKELRII